MNQSQRLVGVQPAVCVQQFASNRAEDSTYLELVKMNQRKEETLKDFMDRFNKMVRQVRDVGPKYILRSLTTALKPRPFADSLYAEPPQTMGELQNRDTQFIRVEEMRAFQKSQKEVVMQPAGHKFDRKEKRKMLGLEGRQGGRYEQQKGQKYSNYMSLGVPRTKIFEEAMQTEQRPPKPQKNNPNGDKGLYCRYHKVVGHSTEECHALKDKIEELIRSGQLKKYVRSDTRRRSPGRDRHTNKKDARRSRSMSVERPLKGHINTILGGFAGGGSTSSARKRHLRGLRSVNSI
ncbi:uncharacterized protein LOC124825602 [Vigna umbellata]|uniref:uncharacterized protein LOC124825601 n=1 Tax=Vigna umbellata TaxID=87088 RepID=UPI001F5F3966|nr:uncharacterized protein LOC124825601 [Vigna umbellata]XP_047154211.1 uncharacterized protein LOC124825602 [Vigna umbellata]